ncbi:MULTISPECIES: tautomerase family protein [Paraburkholderia]|jgi:phenylpyruvate tautomerase PptA (4-oxalocrotonate tautomerase family)|uniref:4-oxalocrotonate tautomerase n=1 Tax=Paraburkholderia caribensis TaxID=75105 RepID=A0A9Q6WNM2_9BURK|nr:MULTISPECIES: tautomerase family protein [Paraburkholderia]MCO4880797.1 tautomerase family protein [Paraburkholderia caribensis]PTB26018.1 tautomerase family protein [Paraburkholderia caribensis]QLB64984.1 4-oxalocrotonate tautomerase [Paraburkholderia caribensis]
MPFTRIALRAGKPAAYRQALTQGIQRALIAEFNVPEDDIFMVITEHDDSNIVYDRNYLGIARSDDLVLIQLTVTNSRTQEQKKALFKRIADNLAEHPGVRREDVFINLVEVLKENWSFGNGIAQYAL